MWSSKKIQWFSGLLIPVGMALVQFTPNAVDSVILAIVGVMNALTQYLKDQPVPE